MASERCAGSAVLPSADSLPASSTAHRVQDVVFPQWETPLLERASLFARSLGESSDVVQKEMFAFETRGGESVCLRPENTAGIVRSLLHSGRAHSGPLRVSYAGPMFRYERPQRGRYRQFQQCGVELLGDSSPSADVEVIGLADRFLQELWVGQSETADTKRRPFELRLNTLGDGESRSRYQAELTSFFRECASSLSPDSQARLARGAVLRILDSKHPSDEPWIRSAPSMSSSLSEAARDRYAAVRSLLDRLAVPYVEDPHLVRGLDYYSHTVFEFVESSEENSPLGTVLAGGRFDALSSELGGPPIAGCGWAAGVDRLALLRTEKQQPEKTVWILPVLTGVDATETELEREIVAASVEAGHAIRQSAGAGAIPISVVCLPPGGKPKKQLRGYWEASPQAASRAGVSIILLVGSSECNKGLVRAKVLATEEQEDVTMEEIGPWVLHQVQL